MAQPDPPFLIDSFWRPRREDSVAPARIWLSDDVTPTRRSRATCASWCAPAPFDELGRRQ
eukprot:3768494-Pleurochrysis_carterae.AAC.1